MSYLDLSDEAKLASAIEFVAREQPLPPVLETFLKENDLYEVITNPGGVRGSTEDTQHHN